MHPLLHWPLMLVRLMRLRTHTAMRLLGIRTCLERLPDFEVDFVAVHDVFGHREDVGDQPVEEVHGHCFADDDAQDFGRFSGRWKGVVYGRGVSWWGVIFFFDLGGGMGGCLLGMMYCFARRRLEMLTCLTWGN
jgi:hypothetical protein